MHTGRCESILQSESIPQIPNAHTSKHTWFRQELSTGHSSLFRQAMVTVAVTGGISGRGGGVTGGLVVGTSMRGGGDTEDAMPATIGSSGGGDDV